MTDSDNQRQHARTRINWDAASAEPAPSTRPLAAVLGMAAFVVVIAAFLLLK